MNAPIRISAETYRIADMQLLESVRRASPTQLRLMKKTFLRLGSVFDWKAAVVCREQARRAGKPVPHSFGFVEQERWWE